MRKVLESIVKSVDDSERTSSAAEIAARGPDVNAMTAICGIYVKRNMVVVIPRPSVIVGASLDVKGVLASGGSEGDL